jgi:GAF domain-containing protein
VATLVAQGEPPEEVFDAVVEEVGRLFRVEVATLVRYEPGRTATSVTTWGSAGENLVPGVRWSFAGHNVTTLVFETGRPARIDGYAESSSGAPAAPHRRAFARRSGRRSSSRESVGGDLRRSTLGLADRVEALDGSIHVHSAAGAGTHITAQLPLEYELAQGAG